LVDLSQAGDLNLEQKPAASNYLLKSHQGYLPLYHEQESPVLWRIRPEGEVKGFWFDPKGLSGNPGSSRLQLFQ